MFLTAALTLAGAVLLGMAARRDEKNPVFVLGGLGLLAASAFLHLTGPASWVETMGYASAELGAGALVVAGMLNGKRAEARSWFLLGSLGVVTGIVVIVLRAVLFSGDVLPTSELSEKMRSQDAADGESMEADVSALVELGPDDRYEEISAVVAAHFGTAEQAFPSVTLAEDPDLAQVWLIKVPKRYWDRLREILELDDENVDHVELNLALSLELPLMDPVVYSSDETVLENDPLVARQWALDAIRGHQAHALLKDLKPTRKARLAIVDSGVDAGHEDISAVFESSPGTTDPLGHGTHCAGIAGAVTNNGLGVASLNWEGSFVEVSSFAAIDANGAGSVESTAQALVDAALAGVDVISMSLGAQTPSIPKTLADAVSFARRRGIIVVAAAGNSNVDASNHVPSNIEGVIAVGAVDQQLDKAKFSNTTRGLSRRISAPGVQILSLRPSGGYVELSGTSMATPMVSGLIAVMMAINPDLTEERVFEILQDSGQTTPASDGVGLLIDAEGAVRAAIGD